jgi:hypothetical protein
MRNTLITLTLIAAGLCRADIVDRVALVVGKTVFTQSEVDDEARLGQLQAAHPLDLSPASRKEAAERLVDQELLRVEMTSTAFQPPATDADALLRRFRQEHFASLASYRAALTRYGVTEEALKQHLAWEATAIGFTDRRFRPFAATQDPQSANRTDGSAQPSAGPADAATDQAMEAWLKQQRAETRIVFKPEAFR